ncbi:MAG: AMP-binding protein, partial [bacterium]
MVVRGGALRSRRRLLPGRRQGQLRSSNEGGAMVRDLVPKELRAEWTKAGYCPGKDLFSLFEEKVADHPDKVAVVDDAGECDYARLGLVARRVAQGLARAGIRAGDVVGVQVPSSWQACAVDLAAAALGAV